MYVLMDLEWVTNKHLHFSPTQIGAMRVNDAWEQQSVFYSRIRPRDGSFYNWKHIGYTGGTALDYLHSPGIHHVLTKLEEWLQDDDIICIWAKDAKNILKSSYNLVLNKKVAQRIVIIGDYVYPLLKETGIQKGGAYRLASIYGLDAPKPKHHSENDVIAMQLALKAIGFSPELFLKSPPQKISDNSQESVAPKAVNPWSENAPYQYDRNARIIHRKGCPEIPSGADLLGYDTLRIALSKQYEVCPACLAYEIKIANRERNQDIINRTEYNFIFVENSEVFHRRDCGLILSTHGVIHGTVYYNTCEETGRRPCKCCNPSPDTAPSPSKKKKTKTQKTPSAVERSMTREEQTSLARFEQAQKERYSRQPEQFESETAKDDFYTLTQPRFAFWASTGYNTFHLRNCRKLQGLTNLKGFSHFNDAVRSGHTPCKFCKPTKKNDISFSLPITSKKREHEKVADLVALCEAHGYPYVETNSMFIFCTPVGRWKINIEQSPYMLYHINLTQKPDDDRFYHRQPRLFLSLLDIFKYIHRHDANLLERSNREFETPSCVASGG